MGTRLLDPNNALDVIMTVKQLTVVAVVCSTDQEEGSARHSEAAIKTKRTTSVVDSTEPRVLKLHSQRSSDCEASINKYIFYVNSEYRRRILNLQSFLNHISLCSSIYEHFL